jgi:hypothetical protein
LQFTVEAHERELCFLRRHFTWHWVANCTQDGWETEENMKWTKSRKFFRTVRSVRMTLAPLSHAPRIIGMLLAALLVLPNAQAQMRDWRAVRDLPPGTRIMVKAEHRYPCSFLSATEDELSCEVPENWRLSLPAQMTFSRVEIREIRKEPNQVKDAWIGAGIGGAAGAAAAASTSRSFPGFHGFVGGLAGAGAGALVGATVPIFQVLFHGGKLIYKR